MTIIVLVGVISILLFLLAVIYKKDTRKMKINTKFLKVFDTTIEFENEKSSGSTPTKKSPKPPYFKK